MVWLYGVHDFSPTPIKQLFMKYDCNYNLRRKLTFSLPKPKSERLLSPLVTKLYLYVILLKIVHAQSQAEACLKTHLNVESSPVISLVCLFFQLVFFL